jgi:hypothetical protein
MNSLEDQSQQLASELSVGPPVHAKEMIGSEGGMSKESSNVAVLDSRKKQLLGVDD